MVTSGHRELEDPPTPVLSSANKTRQAHSFNERLCRAKAEDEFSGSSTMGE